MKCVFYDETGNKCYAEMSDPKGMWSAWDKVDEKTKEEYCLTGTFRGCPRFTAKMDAMTKR